MEQNKKIFYVWSEQLESSGNIRIEVRTEWDHDPQIKITFWLPSASKAKSGWGGIVRNRILTEMRKLKKEKNLKESEYYLIYASCDLKERD